MKVTTTGRKVNLRPSFIETVQKRMDKLDRFFDSDAEAKVTVTLEKDRHTAEVTVKSRGFLFRAERTASDMLTAFNDAADLIVKQIVKNKDRLGTRVKRFEPSPDEAAMTPDKLDIVREKRFDVQKMTVDDAVLQMDMLGHSFFIFINSDTDELSVVYKRHDDACGILIPQID